MKLKMIYVGNSLAVQWLRLCASNAGSMGSIPGQGTKIPHAMRCGQKKTTNKQEMIYVAHITASVI